MLVLIQMSDNRTYMRLELEINKRKEELMPECAGIISDDKATNDSIIELAYEKWENDDKLNRLYKLQDMLRSVENNVR